MSPILQYIGKRLSRKLLLMKNSNLNSQIIRDNVYSIGPSISNICIFYIGAAIDFKPYVFNLNLKSQTFI